MKQRLLNVMGGAQALPSGRKIATPGDDCGAGELTGLVSAPGD
jgi:hypothetical protein